MTTEWGKRGKANLHSKQLCVPFRIFFFLMPPSSSVTDEERSVILDNFVRRGIESNLTIGVGIAVRSCVLACAESRRDRDCGRSETCFRQATQNEIRPATGASTLIVNMEKRRLRIDRIADQKTEFEFVRFSSGPLTSPFL